MFLIKHTFQTPLFLTCVLFWIIRFCQCPFLHRGNQHWRSIYNKCVPQNTENDMDFCLRYWNLRKVFHIWSLCSRKEVADLHFWWCWTNILILSSHLPVLFSMSNCYETFNFKAFSLTFGINSKENRGHNKSTPWMFTCTLQQSYSCFPYMDP